MEGRGFSKWELAKDCRMFRNIARCHVVLTLFIGLVSLATPDCLAGSLSDAKSAVRGGASEETTSSEDSGQLAEARSETRRSTSSHEQHGGGRRRSRHHGHHGHYGGPYFGFHIFRGAPAPVIIERRYVDPEFMSPVPVERFSQPTPPTDVFLSYPYEDDFDGYIVKSRHPENESNASARLSLEGGFETNDIGRGSAGFLVQGIDGLGLDTQWNVYTEDLPGGGIDRLRIGDFNLHYRVAESENMHWRVGIGFNWLKDVVATDYGINFTLGMDWFPAKPIVVSTEVDWGTVGTAEMFHGRVTTGVLLERVEVFGGYDYRTIGSVPLHGPVVGMGLWF